MVTYVLSTIINLWGVFGQFCLIVLLLDELQLAELLPEAAVRRPSAPRAMHRSPVHADLRDPHRSRTLEHEQCNTTVAEAPKWALL
jgi:hypothetical protein